MISRVFVVICGFSASVLPQLTKEMHVLQGWVRSGVEPYNRCTGRRQEQTSASLRYGKETRDESSNAAVQERATTGLKGPLVI